MTMTTRSWDLSGGRPSRVARGGRAREIVVARVLDPFLDSTRGTPVLESASWSVDVWNLDPRVKIVPTAFFRLSPWYEAERDEDGSRLASDAGAEGRGYSQAVIRVDILRRDERGTVHVIGPLPDDVWLNRGEVPDGSELVTAAQGVRIALDFTVTNVVDEFVQQESEVTPWDLVLALEVMPDIRLGCDGLAAEIIDGLHVDWSGTVELRLATQGEE